MLRAEEYDGTFSQQTKIVKVMTCIAPSSFLFLLDEYIHVQV